ncbi:uncharacterized protein METZ01_LOCUS381930 [marine metagenome]|uniref:Uncharacterized protein n=1 Tax=marine metagenome TaxID=408172 RepID=A0A382U439_9ZZZZ
MLLLRLTFRHLLTLTTLLPEKFIRVDTGVVAICPRKLNRVAAYGVDARYLGARIDRGIRHQQQIIPLVHFTTQVPASRTRAYFAKIRQRIQAFDSVIPENREISGFGMINRKMDWGGR